MTLFVTVAVLLAVKWQRLLPKMGRIGRKHAADTTKTGLAHGLKISIHEAQPKHCVKLKKTVRRNQNTAQTKQEKQLKTYNTY